jgi:hypothetical protein
MTIPQRFTNGDATFYVLVVSDDLAAGREPDPIVWEHPFPEGTELRGVLQRQRSLGGRYGTSWIAECRIIPETRFAVEPVATVKESLTDRERYIPGPQQVAECGGPCQTIGPEACDCQDQGALIEALIAAGIARTPLEARHAVAICASHLHKAGGLVASMGAKELREQAGL